MTIMSTCKITNVNVFLEKLDTLTNNVCFICVFMCTSNRRTKWKKQLTSRLKIAQRQGLYASQAYLSSTGFGSSTYHPIFGSIYPPYSNNLPILGTGMTDHSKKTNESVVL